MTLFALLLLSSVACAAAGSLPSDARLRGRKGILYSAMPLTPVLPSLDDSRAYGYVALGAGWFLFLEPKD